MIFITNGIENKKISEESIIPEGWKKGMTRRTWNKGLTKNDHPSLARIGKASAQRKPWNKSKIRVVTKICKNCNKTFQTSWMLRNQKFCSKPCVNNYYSGENNINWNPNRHELRTPYTKRFFSCQLRAEIKIQQELRCPLCGKMILSSKMDLHHIDHNKQNDSRRNLIFLCSSCHNYEKHHRKWLEPQLKKANNLIINGRIEDAIKRLSFIHGKLTSY